MTANPSAQTQAQSSDVAVRTLSGLVLAPAVLALVWLGGLPFIGLLLVVALLMAWEWTRLIGGHTADVPALMLYAAIAVGALAAAMLGYEVYGLGIVAAGVGLSGIFAVARGHKHRLLMMGGVVYVALPVVALLVLRAHVQYGFWCLIWLLAVIWSTDTGAYFTGRTLGGPKVAPSVSPKKTWSGCIGGAICAFIVGAGMAYFLALPSIVALGMMSVLISIVGQAGDFFESAIKRRFGVKDTSNLIPGHGGMLDRLDSLIFAAIVAWGIGVAIAGHEQAAAGVLVW